MLAWKDTQLLCSFDRAVCKGETRVWGKVGKWAVEAFRTLHGWFSPKTYCGEECFTALQKLRLMYA